MKERFYRLINWKYWPELFFFCFFVINFLVTFANYFLKIYFNDTKILTFFYYGLIALLGLLSIRFFLKKITIADFVAFAVWSFLILISYFFLPSVSKDAPIDFFCTNYPFCFIWFVFAKCLIELENDFKKWAKITTFFVCTISLFYCIFLFFVTDSVRQMTLGYESCAFTMLAMYFLSCDKSGKKWIWWFSIAAGITATVLFGSRGPFLICGFYFVYVLFFRIIKSLKKKVIILVIICVCLLVLIINNNLFKLFYLLGSTLENYGVSGRIIDILKNPESLFSSSDRDLLAQIIIDGTASRPFTPFGLFGDRSLTYFFDSSSAYGVYSHNIILEIFVAFGVPLGAIVLTVFCTLIIFTYKRIMFDLDKKAMFVLFFVIGFIALFFSGSFITHLYFYGLWGCVSFIWSKKKSTNYGAVNKKDGVLRITEINL